MKILIATLLFFTTLNLAAQDYYWVGDGGDWSDFANHWATSSGGSTFHTQAPTSTDNVYFDENSFSSANQTLTLDESGFCHDMDWTGVTDDPRFIASSGIDLDVHGSLTFDPSVEYGLREINFQASDAGNNINPNGITGGSSSVFLFRGSGEWTFQGDAIVNAMEFKDGTINFNGYDIKANNYFDISGASGDMELNFSSSYIEVNSWYAPNSFTLNAGTSTLRLDGGCCGTDDLTSGGQTFYNLELANGTLITGSNTFNKITVEAGAEVQLGAGDTQTFNELVALGTSTNLITLKSDSDGNQAILSQSSGSVDITHVRVQDLLGTGGATFNATQAFDDGNNTGWNISAPSGQDYYWVGGTGNWSDLNHWVTTSGGSSNFGELPSQLDDVIFDINSFSSDEQVVTLDVVGVVHDLDFTGVSFDVIVERGASNGIDLYGSLAASDNVEFINVSFDCLSEESETISLGSDVEARKSQRIDFTFTGDGGTWKVLDHLTTDGWIRISCGATFDLNGKDFHAKVFENTCSSGTAGTLDTGDDVVMTFGRWEAKRTNPLSINFGTNVSLVQNHFDNQSLTNQFRGGGLSYPSLLIDNTEKEVMILDNNTIDELQFVAGSTIELFDTQTLTTLSADGNKEGFISIRSGSTGVQSTISISSGAVDVSYVDLTDIAATGGATFTANNSIDNGNNSGWTINAPTGEDYYWIGGSGNWSDLSHWATSSGGSTSHAFLPARLDNVYFDDNSFSEADQVVSIDQDAELGDLNMSAVTFACELNSGGSAFHVYGSVTMGQDVLINIAGSGGFHMKSTDSETITTNGAKGITFIQLSAAGTFTIADPFHADYLEISSGASLVIDDEQLIADEINIKEDIGDFSAVNSEIYARAFDSRADQNKLDYTGSTLRIELVDKVVVSGGSPDVDLRLQNLQNPFALSPPQYNDVVFEEGQIDYHGESIMDELTINAGVELVLNHLSGKNASVDINSLHATGTPNNHIIIRSEDIGERHAINSLSGTSVNAEWLELQDSETSGATFNALNSFDNGNNEGWIITAPPNIPDVPSNLTITEVTTTSFTSDWDDMADATSYRIDIDDQSDFFNPIINDEDVSVSSYQITGLDAGRTYYWRVRSVGVSGISGNTIVQDVVTLPDAPVALSAQSVQSNRFTASWDAPFGVTQFEIDVATDNTFNDYVTGHESLAVTGTQKEVTGLAEDHIYYYRVRAVNESGNSENSNTISVSTSSRQDQTIDFEDLDVVTFGDDPFTLSASATSGLNVTFSSSDETIASINSSTVTIHKAGSVNITASQAGDVNFKPASDVVQVLTIEKVDQFISFDPDPLVDHNLSDQFITVKVVVDTGLPLDVSISEGDATVEEGSNADEYDITFVSSGTTTLSVNQVGNENHNAASESRTFNIIDDSKQDQIITFELAENATKTFGDASFDLDASSSSGLAVTFSSSDESVAMVTGSEMIIVGVGTAIVTASQAGDSQYNPAPSVDRTLTVNKADQIITFSQLEEKTFGDALFSLDATSDSGLPVTFTIENFAIAEIDGDEVTIKSAGSTNIIASQVGDDNFNVAADVSRTFLVNKSDQIITFESIPVKTIGDSGFSLNASSSSGLTVTFTSSNLAVATINGTVVTISGIGSSTITATQDGNANYMAASAVDQVLTVGSDKMSQTITFESLSDKTFGDDPFNLSATASSGLAVSYASSNEAVAMISGSQVTIVGAGSTTITASQTGDDDHDPASDVEQILTVNKASQTITFNPLDEKTFGDDPFNLSATATSGFAITYSSSDASVAAISGTEVTILGAGTTTITASQAGNEHVDPAKNIEHLLTINKAAQIITVEPIDDKQASDDPFDVVASVDSELPLTYAITGPATISNETITLNGEAGVVTVTVTQAGDNNHITAEETISFEVLEVALGTEVIEEIKFYPNPATDFLIIESDKDGDVRIFDIKGTLVFERSRVQEPISLQHLQSGIYLLEILTDGFTNTSKFYKAN